MKKSVLSTILLVLAVIALLATATFLLNDRISAKTFSDIVPNEAQFDSCQIIHVDAAKTLTDEELDDLIARLGQLHYYKQGSYGNVMEGNVYHAFFSSQQTETIEVHISDAGKVYVGANCYELGSKVSPDALSNYLKMLLEE